MTISYRQTIYISGVVEWSACILSINCESYNTHCYVINYTVLLRQTDKTATKC